MEQNIKQIIIDTFDTEAQAILGLKERIPDNLPEILDVIYRCSGKVIVIGMGKSGIAGRKIAATLASTGTSAFYIHPGEAFHGDLGMIAPNDVVIMLSQSGETEEIVRLLTYILETGNPIIAITGREHSSLATHANYLLNVAVDHEACLLDLAPTASVVAQMAMGDALAMALMKMRNFTRDDYARFHPGGSLGRRLLLRIEHVMRKDNLPMVDSDCQMIPLIHAMSSSGLGLVVICNDGIAEGIITDGDIRRTMERHKERFFDLNAGEIATPNPKRISADASLSMAEAIMNEHKISSLIVTNSQGRLTGVVEIFDLIV